MANDMRAMFAVAIAQAAPKRYSAEHTPRFSDYSAQSQLDHRVSAVGRILDPPKSKRAKAVDKNKKAG